MEQGLRGIYRGWPQIFKFNTEVCCVSIDVEIGIPSNKVEFYKLFHDAVKNKRLVITIRHVSMAFD
jgi:hypothetical protein